MQASMANREPPSIEPAADARPEPPSAPNLAQKKPLAKIVHELRNPLSAFTTALHLLKTQPDQPDLVRHLAGMMTQQLDRFTQIVEELAAHATEAKSPAVCSPEIASGGAESLPSMKILLVDDNQSATHMMSRLLEKLGQNVQTASTAAAALDQLPSFTPDIVISDIAMPGMSGYDLARRIRDLDLPKRPYLVAITGYGQESDRQEALAAGFDKHLTKPVGVAALEDLLRTCGCSTVSS
jgi:CheY-like chemotaxis protein